MRTTAMIGGIAMAMVAKQADAQTSSGVSVSYFLWLLSLFTIVDAAGVVYAIVHARALATAPPSTSRALTNAEPS